MKVNVGAMHSDLDQSEREEVMLAFKSGKINILVATDIVARGIDIDDIDMVINYDVPHDPEDYIHRIGRTGRAKASGKAVTFVSEREQGKFGRIEQFLEREIQRLELPEELGEAPAYNPSAQSKDGSHGRGGEKRGGDRKRTGAKPKRGGAKKTSAEVVAKELQGESVKSDVVESSGEVKSKKRSRFRFKKRDKSADGLSGGESKS